MSDLLLRATPALLDGWCGPVVWNSFAATHCIDGLLLSTDGMADDAHGWWGSIYLDLTRAECRDRVARVVAAQNGMTPDAAVCWYYSSVLGGWLLHSRRPFLRLCDEREQSVAYCAEPDFAAWGRWPALATLDPHDDTRLPDGSRRVDAMALLLVAREVLGE